MGIWNYLKWPSTQLLEEDLDRHEKTTTVYRYESNGELHYHDEMDEP